MHGDTSLLIDATRSASRFIYRDYFELENLQQSSKSTKDFCRKSVSRATEVLHAGLSKYYKTIITGDLNALHSDFKGKAALVEPIEGLNNMSRALPFFAIIVTIVNVEDGQIEPEKVIINFPALGEIFYAEKGRGAWVQKHSSNAAGDIRVRISACNEVAHSTLITSAEKTEIANIINNDIRIFDSYSYGLAMLVSGKADACIFNANPISSNGMDLLIKEAGGRSFIHNGTFVGTNFQLYEKIKHLIEKR
jgi:myo-inositol-1(or 4)-monophosphatase